MKRTYNREKIRVAIDGQELVFYCVQCSSTFKRMSKRGDAFFSMRELDTVGLHHINFDCGGDPRRLSYQGGVPPRV